MAFGLFKDGEELFEAAIEEIKRKEYDKASKTLDKALDKKTKNAPLAKTYIAFIRLGKNLDDSTLYNSLSAALSLLHKDSFEFGLATFDTQALIKECDAISRCIIASNMNANDSNKGQSLLDSATALMTTVGPNTLRINEYYTGNSITGTRMATGLMAEANEILAQQAYWTDPQKAAEYQQAAYNFRRQNGESGEQNLERMQQYSKACTCWICGRQAVGEGLHFFVTSADPSPQQIKQDSSELQRSISEGGDLFVCRACYTSISRRADAISRDYYDSAMTQLRNTEARLQSQIASLESAVASLSFQVSMSRR